MVRLANLDDAKAIMTVIDDAKALFRQDGSDQWQDKDNYPHLEAITKDINREEMYVNIRNNEVVGCIVLSSIKEEAYDGIYDGAWQQDGLYMVIHRIAVRKDYYHQGVAKEMMEEVINIAKMKQVGSIKVDTKLENKRMMTLLQHFGFKVVGKINLLRDGVLDKVRIALELKL